MDTFRKFYTENRERIFGYILRRSGNHSLAADIMQESFTRYLERYRDRGFQAGLLFTISRNLLFDHTRKKNTEAPYDDSRHPSGENQEQAYEVREESRQLFAAIQQLDEEERDILAMVVSSGLSYREIAAVVKTSEANIKVKVHRARRKLKKILQQGAP